ncbi:MAG: DUF1573 domain-containing protein [Spirochaetales bacterium]|nr:DUF1573 domain-containing protein [Spirochaetales bacterium]
MKQRIFILMLIIITFFSCVESGKGGIDIDPGSWDFGEIQEGAVVDKQITFTNNESRDVVVDIITTCDCVSVRPARINLKPGKSAPVRIILDSAGESGQEEKVLIIKADLKGFERKFYFINATILGGDEASSENTTGSTTEIKSEQEVREKLPEVAIDYYYYPSCAICRKFINTTLPALGKELNVSINLNNKDIGDPDVYKEYLPRLNRLGVQERAFPVLILGKKVLQGSDEIDSRLKDEIKIYLENKDTDQADEAVAQEDPDLAAKMAILPAISAGLLDGVNPCAFATLISLLTALALAGKRKKEILVIGVFFTLSVFTTYYLVGLGAFKVIQAASSFGIIALIIHWVLVGVLVVFAGLSVYDFYLIRVGRSKEMVMQLSDTFKKKIRNTIKERARSVTIVFSSISLGFLVSLFELGCTGQVYFPFITVYVLKIEKEAFGYILLLLYNLGFILPLIGVFAVTYSGISSQKITKLFQKHMSIIKLLLAVLFIALAVYMIVTK